MKNLTRIVFGLTLGTAAILSAQDTSTPAPKHGRPGGPGRGGHPIVRVLDADKDHELSATEIANASAALLTLDANKDGIVSRDEMRPGRPAGAPDRPTRSRPDASDSSGTRKRPVDPVMLALDADKDGALSAAEIANAPASLRALDANSDGKLTLGELHPLPPSQE